VFYSNRGGEAQIYLMDADGANQVQLTSSTGPNWEPTVAIDGTRIVFTTERHNPGNGSEVYTMNMDGTGETRITTTATWNLEPSWPAR
jgi:TolB protein